MHSFTDKIKSKSEKLNHLATNALVNEKDRILLQVWVTLASVLFLEVQSHHLWILSSWRFLFSSLDSPAFFANSFRNTVHKPTHSHFKNTHFSGF